ncbi:PP2C family protein-serine/threonine phosphatase [Kitasatospora kifunensis]|uniref:Serine phosphatase RsbU (Regulator of sigma subunit) n=1 Tax=Kitasatospora kifunensis TaxID=58351 RepID=A0A7W7VWL6_KITKI|nr:PP2C family protein-serine/threonine phosphatase [Kitasatospora kifunensis]MBB4924645.1 serine phosphatase RsbU (regulator of sigma subunit) [Kitasatospora kifunensis]
MGDKRPTGAAGPSGGMSGGVSGAPATGAGGGISNGVSGGIGGGAGAGPGGSAPEPAESTGGAEGPQPTARRLATLLDLPGPTAPQTPTSEGAGAPYGSYLPYGPAGAPGGEVGAGSAEDPPCGLDLLPAPQRLTALNQLHRHSERLARARGLAATLTTLLDSGAELLGAQSALLVPVARDGAEGHPPLDPAPAATAAPLAGAAGSPTEAAPAVCGPAGADWQDHAGHGPMVGLRLDHAAIGALETIPVDHGPFAGLLHGADRPRQLLHADLAAEPDLTPRFREVAAALGLGACFALPLITEEEGTLGAAVWFYPTPSQPTEQQQELVRSFISFAAPLLAGRLVAERGRQATEALRRGLLPDHLPYLPGLRLAVRWLPAGLDHAAGSDWYDAIVLPDGSIGLTVGSVSGDGPGAGPASATGAASAMGRIRAALRAYAVLEGEDPVSVLGDLELLLKTTEPARTATAVYACLDPQERRITLAGAGHCPPVLVTRYGANFVETSLSAPLGMLSCWEAPGVELNAERGDLLLLYTEGLARRCGPTLHAGQARLRKAAADAPRELRHDPERLCAHLLSCCLGTAPEAVEATDDVVLLAARFE